MQSSTENALELVAVGNAFLRGHDITGFWPEAPTFRWMKTCNFRTPPERGSREDQEWPLFAADPIAWFASLKPWCRGLRLHCLTRERGPNQKTDAPDRMLAAFVGGGPRWLIEAVGAKRSEIWEGFHRLGDRKDPDRRIWLVDYLRQGEIDVADSDAAVLAAVLPVFKDALTDIEAYARSEKQTNFAALFRQALASLQLHKRAPNEFLDALQTYSGMSDEQVGVLDAIMSASVFGGMGSWNDIGGSGPRYDAVSENLYTTLNEATAAVANSTYRG